MIRDRKTVLLLGDVVSLIAAFFVMALIRFDATRDRETIVLQTKLFVILFFLWLIIFFIFDLYNLRKVNPNPRNIGLLGIAIALSSLVSVLAFYLFPDVGVSPKTNLVIVAGFAFGLLVGWRRLFYKLFTSKFVQKIAVIGTGADIEHLIADLRQNPQLGSIVSVQDSFGGAKTLPDVHLVIAHDVDVHGLLSIVREKDCEVLSLFEAYEELFGKIPLSLMTEDRAIDVLTRHNQVRYRFFERVAEILISSIILILTSPFMLVAILAILIEDGRPVIYKQNRVGKNGKLFRVYKLRSMVKDAEADGPKWADKKDSRTTRVGRIIRKLHIDEVPQMINVIKGDIAFVGPRPERPEIVADLERDIPFYYLRHTIQPGFTGWAQIKFRYARTIEDSREKFEYDLYYLLNKNPLFDLGIFLKTIQIIFTH